MADFNAAAEWKPTSFLAQTLEGSEMAVFVSGNTTITRYSLACFDSLGVRHYWVSTAPDTSGAPALGGGATYTLATLTIIRKF